MITSELSELKAVNDWAESEMKSARSRMSWEEYVLACRAINKEADAQCDTIRQRHRGHLAGAVYPEIPDSWNCPINTPGCAKNCGNYGCGN